MCLVDRLQASVPGITPKQLVLLDKLAQTAVFTSQGIPIYAGEEIMRDKKGVPAIALKVLTLLTPLIGD